MKLDSHEIDEGLGYVGYREAFNIIGANVWPVGDEEISLDQCTGRVAARDLVALVSYPSVNVSLKDGFAVKAGDVAGFASAIGQLLADPTERQRRAMAIKDNAAVLDWNIQTRIFLDALRRRHGFDIVSPKERNTP